MGDGIFKKCDKCELNHAEQETCEDARKRVDTLMQTLEVIKSGYGGITSKGTIVDRREDPTAIPFQENSLLGTPKPKKI